MSEYDNMIGVPIMVSGVIYSCMGICCIKSIAESKKRKDRDNKMYREIDDGGREIETV
jgi:hypothetical protein